MYLAPLKDLLDVILFLIRLKDLTYITILTCFAPDVHFQLIHSLTFNSTSFMISLDENSLFMDQTSRRVVVLLDLSCASSPRILNQSSHKRLFNAKYDWILFDSDQINEAARERTKNSAIKTDPTMDTLMTKVRASATKLNTPATKMNNSATSATEIITPATKMDALATKIDASATKIDDSGTKMDRPSTKMNFSTRINATTTKTDVSATKMYTLETKIIPSATHTSGSKINTPARKKNESAQINTSTKNNASATNLDLMNEMYTQATKIDIPARERDKSAKINAAASKLILTNEIHSSAFESNSTFNLTDPPEPAYRVSPFDLLQSLIILPNSNVELIEMRSAWQVYTLYKVRKDSARMTKTLEGEGPLGSGGLSYYNHVNKSRRDNFHREPVRIVEVLIHLDTFKGWDKKESMVLVDLYGWANHELLQCLAFSLNASLVSYLIDDYGWKHTSEAGSFLGAGGLIKFLNTEVADTGSALLLRNDRRVYVNYAATVFPVTTSFLFRQPSLASVSNIYFKTFSPDLWLSTLILMTFITIALSTLLSLSHRYGFETQIVRVSLPDVVMSVLGAICQQGKSINNINIKDVHKSIPTSILSMSKRFTHTY
ncbi:hypothetical protein M8J75_014792 [Diaphorina citri]|nr:hypothetical protein M8J75_014792 [Diaphorina citri]KAI5708445.1 hypothetical protein M8J77_022774 [Diaphorina citri]